MDVELSSSALKMLKRFLKIVALAYIYQLVT